LNYILLVEDNQQNADMVMHIMKKLNIEVRHTLRGLEGAQMARKDRPALILMDFNLPDIDGRTLVLQLKKQLGGEAAPPIIALTARAGEQEMRIAMKFGCDAFLSKPFPAEDLLNLVMKFIPELANNLSSPER
jgi:CheY-like chemotaxis protein